MIPLLLVFVAIVASFLYLRAKGYRFTVTQLMEVRAEVPDILLHHFSVAKDFTRFPEGGRNNGPYSGESLRVFIEGMLDEPGKVIIDLDGTMGYSSAFLLGAFIDLSADYPDVRQRLILSSKEDPTLITEIESYL